MEQNYIVILYESLERKLKVLEAISSENQEQKKILQAEELDMEAFEASVNSKSALVEQIGFLDEGFETMYERVRETLQSKKEVYQKEISDLKELIRRVTDKSVEIQQQEQENRILAEAQFSNARKKVYQVKNSKQIASTYYKNMTGLNQVDPQFMDKKK